MGETRSTDDLLADVPDSIPLDEALPALAHPRRRQLLSVLSRLETPERLSALTRSLAVEAEESDADSVEQLRVCLYHVHVPKLAAAGLVAADDRDAVELTREGRRLADALAR